MPKEIKSLVNVFLNQEDNWKLYLISNWKNIIGKLKDHATLEKIEKDTLIISVDNSSWLQELYLLSNMLIRKINSNLPEPYIKKLRFKLCDKKQFAPRKKTEQKNVSFQAKLNRKEEFALNQIEDKDLSENLKKFLIKCKNTNKK